MKKILLSLLACGIASASFAQSLADIQSPNLLPPPPEAAGLGKYGQIPVDKSSGIPSISIPLYEIKTPRFLLPISLSYHASGIRVSELSPWVGAGWSLNAGGVITRTILNMPDEKGGFLYTPMPTYPQLGTATVAYLASSINHSIDTQPDNFFYNFADQSGAFVFGSDTGKTPVLIPYKPIKITFIKGNPISLPGTFTILDEKGNTYQFNNREGSESGSNWELSGISSWYLSKMISADHTDTLTFVYQKDALGYQQASQNFTQTYSYSHGVTITEGGCLFAPTLGAITQTITSNTVDSALYIKTILFKGGKVDFIAKNGRLDGPHLSLDSVIVSNYDYNQKKYNRLKSFKVNTSYWTNNLNIYNTGSTTGSIYRLKLDSLVENDKNNAAVKTHKFGYDPIILPPINFYAQDRWGYYNGKNTNISTLATQQVVADSSTYQRTSTPYTVGNADRSTDTTYMKAGMLEKITYPTKGYTIFNYECHKFYGPPSTTTDSIKAFSTGYYHDSSTVVYTPTQAWLSLNGGQAVFRVHIGHSAYPFANTYAKITRVSDGAVLYSATAIANTDINTNITLALTAGTQYYLTAVSRGGTSQTPLSSLPNTSVCIVYQTTVAPVLTLGGGPRIKSIKNYDSNGAIISTETYKYGTGENGIGVLMNNAIALSSMVQRTYFDAAEGWNGVWSSAGICKAYYKIYSSSPTYALSTLSGSPVSYSGVTVYRGDTVQNVGKSLYEYANYPDSLCAVDASYQNGIMPVPQTWKNGQLLHEAHYRNNGSNQYALVQEKFNSYYDYQRTPGGTTTTQAVYIGYRYEAVGFQNSNWPFPWTTSGPPDAPSFPQAKYCYFAYPIFSGSRVPAKTITINYANDGVTKLTQDTVNYTYGNLSHMYPTTIMNYDGKGDTLYKRVKYPQDMVIAGLDPTGIYAAMVSANIISPVIQFTQSKNAAQLMQSVTTYASTGGIINPSTVSLQVMGNAAETRLNYSKYDNLGNVATVAKPNGAPVSYIWGYKGAYPVAEVKNAPSNDIFFESFEDGNGNTGLAGAKTGRYGYTGPYTKALSGLDNGSYLLTYWQKTGTVWAMVATPVTVSAGIYTISLSGQFDDVRFYPAAAMMTSYTYDPLIGVTSVTDQKGEISYYEYDSFQRLMNIRDQRKNIIKSFCYNYAGQATNCYINMPSDTNNTMHIGTYTRNNCGTGYIGSAVTYMVPAGTYTSGISQADAEAQAQNDVVANGQNYANLNGTCILSTGFTITNTSGASGLQVTFYGTTNLYYTVPTSGTVTVQIPSGTYSSVSVGVYSGPTHTYTLGTRTPVTNSIAGWSSVNISTGSSDLTLSIH